MTEDRDDGGKFTSGNQAAQGTRHGKTHQLRAWFRDAVTEDDLRAVAAALVEKAKGGDVRAASLLLDRLYGRPRSEPVSVPFAGDQVADMVGAWVEAVHAGEVGAEDAAAAACATRTIRDLHRIVQDEAQTQADMRTIWGK